MIGSHHTSFDFGDLIYECDDTMTRKCRAGELEHLGNAYGVWVAAFD